MTESPHRSEQADVAIEAVVARFCAPNSALCADLKKSSALRTFLVSAIMRRTPQRVPLNPPASFPQSFVD